MAQCLRIIDSWAIRCNKCRNSCSIINSCIFCIWHDRRNSELRTETSPIIQQAATVDVTMQTFTGNGSPILGSHNAQITLVEFGDYQCHFCNMFFHNTEKVIAKNYVDTGKAKIVFKGLCNYRPRFGYGISRSSLRRRSRQVLGLSRHPVQQLDKREQWASADNLARFAVGIGLDMEEFSECMQSRHAQTTASSNKDAKKLGLTGTAFVISKQPDYKNKWSTTILAV